MSFSNLQVDTSKPFPVDMIRQYSILIPIIEDAGKYYILYEMRALKLKTQPGEICFPGGALEQGETPQQCSIRECSEELGISPEKIEIIAENDFCFVGNILINSFIGKLNLSLEEVKQLKINKDEVEEIFEVPLEYFLYNDAEEYWLDAQYSYPEDFPYHLIPNGKDYKYRFTKYRMLFYQYAEKTIWGITAKFTESAIRRLHLCEPTLSEQPTS